MIQELTPDVFAGSPNEASYFRNAPNPEDWPALIEKHNTYDATEIAWPEEDLESIAAPTLLMFGDSDIVRPEHAVDMFRLLGGGMPGDFVGLSTSQLAILPGITHVSIVFERTELLLAMIETFLAAPMPEAA